MAKYRLIVLVIVAAPVQTGFLAAWRPFGVVPNLLLALAVLVGLRGLSSRRLGAILAGGVVLDLAAGDHFGFWMVALCLTMTASGLVARAGFRLDNIWSGALIVAGASLLVDVAILLPLVFFGVKWQLGYILARLLVGALFSGLAAVCLWPAARWVTGGSHDRQETISL